MVQICGSASWGMADLKDLRVVSGQTMVQVTIHTRMHGRKPDPKVVAVHRLALAFPEWRQGRNDKLAGLLGSLFLK